MAFINNVTRYLDGQGISYRVYTYAYDAGVHSAVQVANAIGLPPEQVFKTLVTVTEDPKRKPILAVIPGPASLNLKALAKAVKAKKVKMATHEQAEAWTGLQTGGISALALINKGFDVYLDDRAKAYESIAVSAGQRGAEIQLHVEDLVRVTRARVVTLDE